MHVDSMSLIAPLLRAIVLVDGDGLVLHAGEKPYVTSPSGKVDLAGGAMSAEAVSDVIGELLPAESQRVLTQSGAVQHDLGDISDFPGERFQVVATSEGSTLWVEIRRHGTSTAVDREARPAESPAPASKRRQSDRAAGRQRADTVPPPALSPAVPPAVAAPAPLPGRDTPVGLLAPRPATEADLLQRLLQDAVAEGASTLFLASGVPPWIRIDDELKTMERVPALTPGQIEAMLTRAPAVGAAAAGDATREWLWEFPDLGRMRCTSFRDHRGPGLVLRSVPTRPLTSRQLGLSRDVESLTTYAAGLILVASPRANGARTVVAALVDLINRTRRVHVVTVEREISVLHDSEASFVSQRESGRSLERLLEMSRGALREEPDVLVIETAQSAELMTLALEAAHGGRLVICGFRGDTASRVVEDAVALYPPSQRQLAQLSLARSLVGVVVRPAEPLPAIPTETRELLLNSAEVAGLIAEGRFTDLASG